MTPATIDPARTALVLMDLQPAVLAGVGADEALVERAAAVLAAAREAGLHVAHVSVAFTEDDYAAIPDANIGFSALRDSGFLAHGTAEAAHHPAVAPADGDIVVRKVRVGAFSTTDLDRQLRERGVDTLILAGVSTSGVILSTVRDAADRDYRIFVLSDVVMDPVDEVHRVLIEHVLPRQAHVIASEELLRLLPTSG